MPCLPRRRQCLALLGAAALGRAGLPAQAAAWPSRTVRLLVPFPVGGTVDVVARLLAERLAASLGQQVIVDPKPGANGIIAGDAVAKAAPDGHTLLLVSTAHASNASLYSRMPYDTARDFLPVALSCRVVELPVVVEEGHRHRLPADLVAVGRRIGQQVGMRGEQTGQ